MPEITVSAIIVTHNSAALILRCLESLMPQISGRDEIILFDNSSNDATVSSVKSTFPHIRIETSVKNLGFAAACNSAAAKASGHFLLFVNPDLMLDIDCFNQLVKFLSNQDDCGLVTARLRYPDGAFQPNCREYPSLENLVFSRGSFLRRLGIVRDRGRYTLPDFQEATAVPVASATCILITREFFRELDGFDPRFFLFMEDTDLCFRVRQAGKKIYFLPRAEAVHEWGRGAAVSRARRLYHHHHSLWKYFLKHHPNGFSLLLLPLLLVVNYILQLISTPGEMNTSG